MMICASAADVAVLPMFRMLLLLPDSHALMPLMRFAHDFLSPLLFMSLTDAHAHACYAATAYFDATLLPSPYLPPMPLLLPPMLLTLLALIRVTLMFLTLCCFSLLRYDAASSRLRMPLRFYADADAAVRAAAICYALFPPSIDCSSPLLPQPLFAFAAI